MHFVTNVTPLKNASGNIVQDYFDFKGWYL